MLMSNVHYLHSIHARRSSAVGRSETYALPTTCLPAFHDRAITFTAEVELLTLLEPCHETHFLPDSLSRALGVRHGLRVTAFGAQLWNSKPEIHGK